MIIYQEVFPDCYLLALASSASASAPAEAEAEAELAAYLAHACCSGKPAVWVDCRLLQALSATGAWLLWACQQRLRRRRARLVLCQVPAAVERALRSTLASAGASLLIVPTLDDAAALA